MDFEDIKGQEAAKRAIVVALAGLHKTLLMGPPGCGKTMLRDAVTSMMGSPVRDHLFYESQPIRDDDYDAATESYAIVVKMPAVSAADLYGGGRSMSTAGIRAAVGRASLFWVDNPDLPRRPSGPIVKAIDKLAMRHNFTARETVRTIGVARTIATLDRSRSIEIHHITEAFALKGRRLCTTLY